MYTEYIYENSLSHHGIIGQKWGVRRFQNPDGSLTSAGKVRYADGRVEQKKRDKERSQERFDKAIAKRERIRDEGYTTHEKALMVGAGAAALTAGKIYVNYQIANGLMGGTLKATPTTYMETAAKAGRNAALAYAGYRVADHVISGEKEKKNK